MFLIESKKMSFSVIAEVAEKWTKANSFVLLDRDEVERRLVFTSNDGRYSFYIISPASDGMGVSGSQKWIVDTDCTEFVPALSPVKDFCSNGSQKTVTDILDRVAQSLVSMSGARCNMDNDDDDDDYDCDDDNDDNMMYDDWMDVDENTADKKTDTKTEEEEHFAASSTGSRLAVKRLLTDMKVLQTSGGKYGITGLPRGDNLFIWDVTLADFPKESPLAADLKTFAKKYKEQPVVHLEMAFPTDYPMAPPFVRILKPRFKFLTGHVTIGGSICMQMLTKSGWSPSNDIESILIQIRAEIISDPNTRLDMSNHPERPYSEEEAKSAFQRMIQRYGWSN